MRYLHLEVDRQQNKRARTDLGHFHGLQVPFSPVHLRAALYWMSQFVTSNFSTPCKWEQFFSPIFAEIFSNFNS
jgi:hypothetical protein